MSAQHGVVRLSRVAVLLTALVAGCSLGPKATEQPASYDLGPPRQHTPGNPAIATMLLVPEVVAPAWLAGNGIVYRLNYENQARAYAYAQSRWTAPPAALLTQRLLSRLAAASRGIVTGADGVRADHQLRVDLEDFSQSFDSPAASRVTLRARASLVDVTNRGMIAQRVFAIERTTATPDAAGAVQALAAASDELVEGLLAWTAESLKPAKTK